MIILAAPIQFLLSRRVLSQAFPCIMLFHSISKNKINTPFSVQRHKEFIRLVLGIKDSKGKIQPKKPRKIRIRRKKEEILLRSIISGGYLVG